MSSARTRPRSGLGLNELLDRTKMWSVPKPSDESPDPSATKYEPDRKCEFRDCCSNAGNLLVPPFEHAWFKLANGQEDRAPVNRVRESARQYPHTNKRQSNGESYWLTHL